MSLSRPRSTALRIFPLRGNAREEATRAPTHGSESTSGSVHLCAFGALAWESRRVRSTRPPAPYILLRLSSRRKKSSKYINCPRVRCPRGNSSFFFFTLGKTPHCLPGSTMIHGDSACVWKLARSRSDEFLEIAAFGVRSSVCLARENHMISRGFGKSFALRVSFFFRTTVRYLFWVTSWNVDAWMSWRSAFNRECMDRVMFELTCIQCVLIVGDMREWW